MNKKSLSIISKTLKKALVELNRCKFKFGDTGIRQRYAEYLVAMDLAKEKKRYEIQILEERDKSSADICLVDRNDNVIRVEVKSGKMHEGWAGASFGRGNQIKEGKFDYCVFVVFAETQEKVIRKFVFGISELGEIISKRRKNLVAHNNTNPYVLLYAPSLKEYLVEVKSTQRYKIERDLLNGSNRKKYEDAWTKIRPTTSAFRPKI